MKKFTRILSLLLIVVINLSVVGVYADDAILGEEYILEIEDTEQLDETVPEESNYNEELIPMSADECPTYVPGIGWTGTPAWNQAIGIVQAGGHIQGWGTDGKTYLSENHARLLISAAGLEVYGNVEQDDGEHNYPHIHYWLRNSRHNSIRVK